MKSVLALAASQRKRAVAAALSAALLASCSVSTGDPIELASPSFAAGSTVVDAAALAGPAGDAVDSPPPSAEADPADMPLATAQPAFVMDADDEELPAEVSYVPALKPGAALAAAAPAQIAAEAMAPAPPEGAPAVAPETTALAPEPVAEPRKRGFLAGLFDSSAYPPAESDDYRQAMPRARGQSATPVPTAVMASAPPAPEIAEEVEAEVAMAAPAVRPEAPPSVAPAPEPAAPTVFLESGPGPAAPAAKAQKRGFLAGFFSNDISSESEPRPVVKREARPAPVVTLASTGPVVTARASGQPMDALPGVRQSALFEITRKSGMDDDDDIDLHEDEGPVRVASAAGLARLAPNGLLKQTEHVDVACLKPSLVRVLKTVERHYGKQVVVTSGYRSPTHNRRARGARNSLHMYCAAADVQVPGVSKLELARFVRAMPGRGGVGTYCHTDSVHIDVGPERDWDWRCRRKR